MWSQCLPYQGELDGGFVADGELVVARRDASGLLQQADPVLDLVSELVFLAVEDGRTASGRTLAEAVSHLVPLLRDGVRDAPPSQVFADLAGGVGPVGEHVNGPGPRTAKAGRGTRMRFISSVNSGASPRWPAVTAAARTWKEESTARWIFVVRPPRERPIAWSAGSAARLSGRVPP